MQITVLSSVATRIFEKKKLRARPCNDGGRSPSSNMIECELLQMCPSSARDAGRRVVSRDVWILTDVAHVSNRLEDTGVYSPCLMKPLA